MEFEDQEEADQLEVPHSHQPPPPPPPPPSYDSLLNNNSYRPKMSTSPVMQLDSPSPRKPCRYKECLKNHAVGLGGHAVDGCCEFMPAGPEGTLDALKCAACNCHRNFHRKEPSTAATGGEVINFPSPHYHPHHPQPQNFLPYYRTPSGYLHVTPPPLQQQRPLALPSTSGGVDGGSQDQEEEMANPLNIGNNMNSLLRKRHRTKFTPEQKDKMIGLAERLGWRIQKQDDEAVQQFCEETGVRRHVLKVWMHNNKHTLGKKP